MLLAEDVFERVYREARGTFSFYFESVLAGEVDTLVSSVLFLSSVAVRLFGGIFQRANHMRSNYRHKIRFQDIVYFKLNE